MITGNNLSNKHNSTRKRTQAQNVLKHISMERSTAFALQSCNCVGNVDETVNIYSVSSLSPIW